MEHGVFWNLYLYLYFNIGKQMDQRKEIFNSKFP